MATWAAEFRNYRHLLATDNQNVLNGRSEAEYEMHVVQRFDGKLPAPAT